jgi:hypothetical protein
MSGQFSSSSLRGEYDLLSSLSFHPYRCLTPFHAFPGLTPNGPSKPSTQQNKTKHNTQNPTPPHHLCPHHHFRPPYHLSFPQPHPFPFLPQRPLTSSLGLSVVSDYSLETYCVLITWYCTSTVAENVCVCVCVRERGEDVGIGVYACMDG